MTASNPDNYFGYVPTTSIGDFVWNDLTRTANRTPVSRASRALTVTLFTCGPDGQVGGSDDVNTGLAQTTPASGAYVFSELAPGCYFVTFTTPAGYAPTTANTDADATDSDAVAGVTGPYTAGGGPARSNGRRGLLRGAGHDDRQDRRQAAHRPV